MTAAVRAAAIAVTAALDELVSSLDRLASLLPDGHRAEPGVSMQVHLLRGYRDGPLRALTEEGRRHLVLLPPAATSRAGVSGVGGCSDVG